MKILGLGGKFLLFKSICGIIPSMEKDNEKSKNSVLSVPISGSVQGRARKSSNDDDAPRQDIEDAAKEMATKAGMNLVSWEPGYANLVQEVSGFYAEEIRKLISPINRQMTKYLNGLRYDLESGPKDVLLQAEGDFKSLNGDALKYHRNFSQFNKELQKEQRVFPNLTELGVRKTKIKTSADGFLFFAVLGLIVLVESAANMSLLSSALEGGLIQAFMVAVLVSVINVMVVGTGMGFLCAFLFRKIKTAFYAAVPVWLIFVVALNVIVGGHREKYVLAIEEKEKAAEGAVVELSEVSYNFLSWSFESVLFFLLGIGLCCFGFYKGITYSAPGENLKFLLDKLDVLKDKIEQGIESIPARYKEELKILKDKVSKEKQELLQLVGEGETRLQNMEGSWNGLIHVIQTEFVSSYNKAHPEQKIDLETLQNARETPPFPAHQAVRDAVARAKKRLQEYESSDQQRFYDAIYSANSEIARMQGEYRQSTGVLMHGA